MHDDVLEIVIDAIWDWVKSLRSSPEPGSEPASWERPLSEDELNARARVGRAICTLLMAVARADGKVDEVEIGRIRDVLAKQAKVTRPLKNAIVEGLRAAAVSSVELSTAAEKVRRSLNEAEVLLVLDALYAVAQADGQVLRPEMAAIRQIAALLEIDP